MAKRTKLSILVEEALSALARVHSVAQGILPVSTGNPRNITKANDIVAVFKGYEKRLHELSSTPGGLGQSNRQRELLRWIVQSADSALNSLTCVSAYASSALDRAYAQGTNVEEYLNGLVANLKPALFACTGSTAGQAVQISLSTQSLPATVEQYRAAHVIPPLPDNLRLELDSHNESGKYRAPEGDLKSKLLKSTSTNSAIAARGAIVHGASEMAGVGKTTALIALGHDEDVRDHFKDGILFLTLGQGASVEDIVRGLAKIMKFTGALTSADAVKKETNLSKAVEAVALWFLGKRNLFLVDDEWPTNSSEKEYLPQLRYILEGNPESRMVLTTRSRQIVLSVGAHVDFDARDPLGSISTSIFTGVCNDWTSCRC